MNLSLPSAETRSARNSTPEAWPLSPGTASMQIESHRDIVITMGNHWISNQWFYFKPAADERWHLSNVFHRKKGKRLGEMKGLHHGHLSIAVVLGFWCCCRCERCCCCCDCHPDSSLLLYFQSGWGKVGRWWALSHCLILAISKRDCAAPFVWPSSLSWLHSCVLI